MNIRIRSFVIAALALGLTGTVAAHHSAVQFDFSKQVQYTGTVKEFAAINPHMRMTLELKDAKGIHEVKFEGHSTNNMYRAGYRKGMVKSGDTITVNAAPYRDGTEGGYVIAVTKADGQFFGVKGRAQAAPGAPSAGEEVRRQAEGR
jgi:Family of unknown function (DUF6152)